MLRYEKAPSTHYPPLEGTSGGIKNALTKAKDKVKTFAVSEFIFLCGKRKSLGSSFSTMATHTRVFMPHKLPNFPSGYSLKASSICHMFGPSRAAQLGRTCVMIARNCSQL